MSEEKIAKLAEFGRRVLHIMESMPEWNSDLPDEIAAEAERLGLSELDYSGSFRVKLV